MSKIWRVARYEYHRHVFRKRFLLTVLGVPLFIGLIFLVGVLIVAIQTNRRPIGYVDHSGLLANPILPDETDETGQFDQVDLIAYESEAEAQTALKGMEIQAYYILAPDYRQTYQADLVYLDDKPEPSVRRQFEDLVRANLFKDQPSEVVERINQGFDLVTRTLDGHRQPNWVLIVTQVVLPVLTGFVFIIAIITSSGYLMQAVVEEKENRTMEVLVTSLSPGKLITGKILGITGVGLTQILAWSTLPLILFFISRNRFPSIEGIQLEPTMLLLLVAIMLPTYILVAALMMAVGATITKASEGQQVAGIFIMPIMIPFWFFGPILNQPHSPLALGLSFFPLTAPITLTLRMSIATVPAWQIMLNIGELVLAALGAIWIAGRAFQLGMLRYGQRLKWREIFKRERL